VAAAPALVAAIMSAGIVTCTSSQTGPEPASIRQTVLTISRLRLGTSQRSFGVSTASGITRKVRHKLGNGAQSEFGQLNRTWRCTHAIVISSIHNLIRRQRKLHNRRHLYCKRSSCPVSSRPDQSGPNSQLHAKKRAAFASGSPNWYRTLPSPLARYPLV